MSDQTQNHKVSIYSPEQQEALKTLMGILHEVFIVTPNAVNFVQFDFEVCDEDDENGEPHEYQLLLKKKDGKTPAELLTQAREGWIRAVDEELVSAGISIANETDTHEEAKRKLDLLINWNIDVATDPELRDVSEFNLVRNEEI